MSKIVGSVDMDAVKNTANAKIDRLLKDAWLDPDTVKDFKFKQRKMQANAFRLVTLGKEIEQEITHRQEIYGSGKRQA